MAHDDIWDDSALVNSWDEALAEYQKYHSIHLTGGNIDQILTSENEQHDKPELRVDDNAESTPLSNKQELVGGRDTPGPAMTDERLDTANAAGNVMSEAAAQGQAMRDAKSAMPSPEALLGTVQDESLKRLLMSWYYAGFYTGFHQGQQNQRQAR